MFEIYKHAPIVEAALDIRTRNPKEMSEPELEAAKDDAYPNVFQRPSKISVKVEQDQVSGAPLTETLQTFLGVSYRSLDEKQVFQVRNDGFTHNRLHPYEDWSSFSKEARRLWIKYKEVMNPEAVELIGLNYVNEIMMPSGADFREYFNTYVEVPSSLPQQLYSFALNYQVTIPDMPGFLYVSQSYGPQRKEGSTTIVLNIQAYNQIDTPLAQIADDQLWEAFEKLRVAKSKAFEACITDSVREMIR